jgi:hypothetical protein
MVRQLFSPTVRWSDSSIVRHNRNYLTISGARKTRYMYDYNLMIAEEVSQTGHWQQVYMNTLHYDNSWAWFFAVLWWPFWKWRLVDEWGAILQSPCPSVRLSVRSHFRNRYLSFYWKKWFYIWYMALAWWLVHLLLPRTRSCRTERKENIIIITLKATVIYKIYMQFIKNI